MSSTDTVKLLTDAENGRRFVELFGDRVRYCHQLSQWFFWDGTRWAPDNVGTVLQLAKTAARSWLKDAAEAEDDRLRKAFINHADDSESLRYLKAMLTTAASEPPIPVLPTTFDSDPWLFPCANALIDLRTGKAREAKPSDHVSRISPVRFDPAATCPLWEAFWREIQDRNAEMVAYIRRWLGMSLTGDVSTQELPIWFGAGSNGKSLALDTVMYVMGDYATPAPDSLLTMRHHPEHATEIMDLCGRRLVVGSETEEGAKLRIGLVKKMTGEETLKGRAMRCDFVTFKRTHKLILVSNHKPRINDAGHAVWRRIKVVPFRALPNPVCRSGVGLGWRSHIHKT